MAESGITLYAMGEKGLAVVKAIVDDLGPESLQSVITASDKNVVKDYRDEIESLCREHSIPCHGRKDAPGCDGYALAIGWRWLIEGVRDLIILHDSLLPRYRGFAPLVSALINGDEEIGVTALFATSEFDRGEIIAQERISIEYPIKIADAIKRIVPLYRTLALEIARRIVGGEALSGTTQDESLATYSLWRDESDYRIDWTRDAAEIRRFVDAVGFPYRGAFTRVDGVAARVYGAKAEADVAIENRSVGKVLFVRDESPLVVCGTGLLRINALVNDQTGDSMLPLERFRSRFDS